MISAVLMVKNLYSAYRQVLEHKGSSGIYGMTVYELADHFEANRTKIMPSILHHTYVPEAIRSVEIPKGNEKARLLWIPTEPEKNSQQSVTQSLKYINDGYWDILDIDLKGFFDEVDYMALLQLIYDKVKCPTTLRLIRKFLRAPIY